MTKSIIGVIRKKIIKEKEAELKLFCANKDYSRADELFHSDYWNTSYTGLLMRSELSLEDPSLETRVFSSSKFGDLSVKVSREAQIQMHIWYSILKNKTFLKNFSKEHRDLLINKARNVWGNLIRITQGLSSSKDLILHGILRSEELNKYGESRRGIKSWSIRLDNSNRFIYIPKKYALDREILVIECMFHYKDPIDFEGAKNEGELKERIAQDMLSITYGRLDKFLPKKIDSIKFRSVVKTDYLSELFGNPNLINLRSI